VNRWQDILINSLPAMMLSMGMNLTFNGILAPEIERRPVRELMDWELYLQESYRKVELAFWQEIIRQWRQWLIELKLVC
jgi:hypothetical protein